MSVKAEEEITHGGRQDQEIATSGHAACVAATTPGPLVISAGLSHQ